MSEYVIHIPNITIPQSTDDKIQHIQYKLKEVETKEYRSLYSNEKVISDRRFYTTVFKNLLILKAREQSSNKPTKVERTFDELYT